tara:strand:+ start:4927 stop:6081 length:1155 start_codon:yes stop_codon:yes gene_type:complete
VRQSVQIKFDDLKLPASVIEILQKNNTVSLRPNLSNALKKELDGLRVLQRELYESYCIHFGDCHFITGPYFFHANALIKEIRDEAAACNLKLRGLWEEEYHNWQETAEGILRPLFSDEQEYQLALAAYNKIFPTKNQYTSPIRVSVLGPLPVSLQEVTQPIQGDLDSLCLYENQINTHEVLEAAREGAADKALHVAAELLDDLDSRTLSRIGRQQIGSDRKRGSWQLTAEKLKLISTSVPGFNELSKFADQLLEAGTHLQSPSREVRTEAAKTFHTIQGEIRKELNNICNQRDSSEGLEKLKQSLALSTTYKDLCNRIKLVENSETLESLIQEASLESDIYTQRSKHLNKLIQQRKELFQASSKIEGTTSSSTIEGWDWLKGGN